MLAMCDTFANYHIAVLESFAELDQGCDRFMRQALSRE